MPLPQLVLVRQHWQQAPLRQARVLQDHCYLLPCYCQHHHLLPALSTAWTWLPWLELAAPSLPALYRVLPLLWLLLVARVQGLLCWEQPQQQNQLHWLTLPLLSHFACR
jgi:hypothetical protein